MEKKKVYIETTVVSDATALPTNDLALVGRQVATREWWESARERFELFVSPVVRREVANGDIHRDTAEACHSSEVGAGRVEPVRAEDSDCAAGNAAS